MAQVFAQFEHGSKAALVLAWLRYRLEQGATLQNLVNQAE